MAVVLVVALASARAQTQVELILDASGSMWNRVADGRYLDTRDGKELGFTAPSEPGAYELRYQSDGTEIGVLGRGPLTVHRLSVHRAPPA